MAGRWWRAGSSKWTALADETDTTVSVVVTAAMDGDAYRAVLKNGVGGKVISNGATLSVVTAA